MNENEQQKIDWEMFDKPGMKFFKPEVNKEYCISFNPEFLGQEMREIIDKKTKEKKQVPALLLKTDMIDRNIVEVRWEITSVRLIKTIKEYYEKGILFKKVFILKKTGEGTQTLYTFYPSGDKSPAKKAGSSSSSFETIKVKLTGWTRNPMEILVEDGNTYIFQKDAVFDLPILTAKLLINKGIGEEVK